MQLKIMSANIRFDNPQDQDRSWNPRRPVMVKSIQKFSPHILGTQEGRKLQLEDLAHHLNPSLELVSKHRDWIDERMYPCLFYDPKAITYHDSGDIWLSETPFIAGSKSFDSAFPRLMTWMKGSFKESDQSFLSVNVHLDHVHHRTRVAQIEVLTKHLKSLLTNNDIIILTGDFNEGPQEEVRLHLHDQIPNIYDPWFILDKPEESSHHDLHGHYDDNRGHRIDWILVSRELKPFDIFIDKMNEDGIYPSDHFPVKAVFNL